MTPEQKADQLIRRFTLDFTMDFHITKQCALIAIHEILFLAQFTDESIYKYWQEVKQEIEKL